MALIVLFHVPGMTQQQYDEVIEQLDAEGFGAPDGRLHHVAASTNDGWFVADIWESQEKLNAFAEILMPTLVAAGVTPTQPEIHPVHNMISD